MRGKDCSDLKFINVKKNKDLDKFSEEESVKGVQNNLMVSKTTEMNIQSISNKNQKCLEIEDKIKVY
jgi:hypothetical protein